MRQDFIFMIPASVAQEIANRKCRRTMFTGAIVTAISLRYWILGLVLLAALAIMYVIQRRR